MYTEKPVKESDRTMQTISYYSSLLFTSFHLMTTYRNVDNNSHTFSLVMYGELNYQ